MPCNSRSMKYSHMPKIITESCLALSIVIAFLVRSVFAQPGTVVSEQFDNGIRPLITTYCLGCHSTQKHKGDLDLERFKSADEVLKHPMAWQGVIEQLELGEMPPKEKPQLTPQERLRLLTWVNATLDEAAKARAGDPEPVLLRRLSTGERGKGPCRV